MIYESSLKHHGILGMKCGVRRYQNKDGSMTPAGRKRYRKGEMIEPDANDNAVTKRVKKDYNNLSEANFLAKYHTTKNTYRKRVNKYIDPYMNAPLAKLGKYLNERNRKKIINRCLKSKDAKVAYDVARNTYIVTTTQGDVFYI